MYLKRLELRGFKTFASYTDFIFDAGITAIVGPNGSGKSNIADAIRWVLGEQSYTALRGKRTEDMIFAGTSRRPQLGMAEVVITFDNTSHWLPLDFSEVTICRRAYRSGENQYLINGSHVRLRDVLELLGKAGLGCQGFLIIGQGLVDAALSLRPEERRILFEEAAGVRIYQEKRNEALSKLAETQHNILRLNDILNEIAPQLHNLEHQAKRTEERELLQRDLEKLLRIWYGYHWQRLQAKLCEAEILLQRRRESLNLGQAKLHELEALIASTRTRQGELRRQLSIWHEVKEELHNKVELTERQLAVSRERLSLLQQRRTELQAELAQLRDRRSALLNNVATVKTEWQRLQNEKQIQTNKLRDSHAKWQHSEAERRALEREVETGRDKLACLAATLAEAHNHWEQLQNRRVQALAEYEKQRRIHAEIEAQLLVLRDEWTQACCQQQALLHLLKAAKARQEHLQERLALLEKNAQQRREALAEVLRQRQRVEDKRDILHGLRREMVAFTSGVRAVLEAKDKLPGIIGTVISLLQAPKKLERAIEAALGSYAQALVVERWEDAQTAIAELRAKAEGWATFLPLDSLVTSQVQAANLCPSPKGVGVLGLAQQLVKYDPRYENVFQLLLGGVVIVEDLATAKCLRSHLQPGQRLVTLSGEVMQDNGVISGGWRGKESSLLAQEQEWRKLLNQLTVLQQEEQAIRKELLKEEKQCQVYCQELTAVAEELTRLSQEHDVLESNLTALQQKHERLQRELDWRRKLEAQQQSDLLSLDTKSESLQREIDERTQEHNQWKANMEMFLASLESARQKEEAIRQKVMEEEIALAVTQQHIRTQAQLVSNHKADLEGLKQQIAAKFRRMIELQHESNGIAAQVHILQREMDELSVKIAELATRIEPAEAEVLTLDSQLSELEEELVYERQRSAELEALYTQQLLEKERRHDALEALKHRIEEELGDIEYPSEHAQQLRLELFNQNQRVLASTYVLPEGISIEIKELKTRLRRLGSVNPYAPQEYQKLLQRYQFLQSQIADLEQSTAALQQVVKELDQAMEREFLSIFSIAAENLPHYFEILFGGGQAKLILTNPNNPATSGVDIIARLPGKRQQPLALLSGGERALIATALLFAVLKARPLPFCLLDEVDAMLDEANVGRFRTLLEEFAQRTQFIVITHNRRTIEAANTIYGVSMTEEGVSKVISLQLEEKPAINSN